MSEVNKNGDAENSDGNAMAPAADAPEHGVQKGRRAAVAKLAYASPVLAGLLFSRTSGAQSFSPPGTP